MSDFVFSAATAWDRMPLLATLAMLVLKVCAILLTAGLVAAMLGRSSAAKRHLVWTAGIAAAVLLPFVTLSLPEWRVPVRYSVAAAATANPTAIADGSALGASAASDVAPRATPLAPPGEFTLDVSRVAAGSPAIGMPLLLLALWLIGALVALAPWIAGVLSRSRLAADASDLLPGEWERSLRMLSAEGLVPRRARVLASAHCGTPMTWGVLRAIVLVPRQISWTENERRNALLHEFAHVRRADYLAKLLSRVLCTLYWFNPVAWLVARAERLAREQACDDAVLRAGSRPSSYAQQLLDVAHGSASGTVAAAALTMARPSSLAQRLRAILDAAHDRSPGGRALASATVAGACALLPPVAALSPEWIRVSEAREAASAPSVTIVEAAPPPTSAPEVAATSVRVAPRPLVIQQGTDCPAGSGKRNSTSVNHSDNSSPDRRRWQVKWSDGVCRIELDARGTFTLSPNADDIIALSGRGYVDIEHDDGRTERRVRISRENGAGLQRTYWVDGDRREWNAEAAAWFARILIALDRRTAFAVDSRLPALLQSSGVEAVMTEVALMPSSYAQRTYYTKLFARASLTPEQLVRVLQNATRTFDSGYDKAELLLQVAKQQSFAEPVHLAYATMARSIDSDYEKRRALGALLARGDLKPEVVQTMLAATEGMDSDFELAELLIGIDRRYAVDENTRPHYVRALATIQSDYEQRRVLQTITKAGNLGAAAMLEIIGIAGRSMRGYQLAEFLADIAAKGALDQAASTAFFAAVRNIESDYEKRRVLQVLLKNRELPRPVIEGIIATAATIEGDHECATLLVSLSRVVQIDETLRPAYEKAAATIGSDYEYGRAMSAARRATQQRG